MIRVFRGGSSNIPGRLSAAALLLYVLMAGPVFAQYYDSPGLGERPVETYPQDYKPLGIRAGSFMLHPGVQLAAQWTDNVFYANQDLSSDVIFHIRPYIRAQSTWSRHSLNISLAADFARYADFSERDYEDYFFGITGQVDVKNRSYFSYSADYMDLHEGLNNRTSEQGVEPTRYNMYGGSVGYDHTFNRLSLGATYAINYLSFDNVIGGDGGIIDNEDRNRSDNNIGLRASYQFQTDKAAYVNYSFGSVDYDQQFDRNGYDRTGSYYSVGGGLSFSITGKLNGNIGAVYSDRGYDDPRLPNTSGWGGSAGLQWTPTHLTSIYGSIATSAQETTDSNSSGFLGTVYSLRVDHELKRFVQVNGFVSYRTNDYQTIDTTLSNTRTNDNVTRAGVGANWFINRHMYLNGSYAWESLDSNLPGDDYTSKTFWLMFGMER